MSTGSSRNPTVVPNVGGSSSSDHPILSKVNFVKIIGTGTFARVYLVRNGANQKFEAVKVLSISDVVRMKQIEHVKNERSILNEVMHPFLINLRWHTKDETNLYLGFPYICGGELFSYLRSSGRFAANAAQFYAAEIVSALSYLHSLSIVYRDLKVGHFILIATPLDMEVMIFVKSKFKIKRTVLIVM